MSPGTEKPIRMSDYVLTNLQHIYPQHLLSLMMFKISRLKSAAFKNRFIAWFVRKYRIDMQLAENPEPTSYADFNSFFTRSLRHDARPLSEEPGDIVSPADGVISQLGEITNGLVMQAKRHGYSVDELLSGDPVEAARYANGRFATIYLSPRDYHRVHMPLAGALTKMVYVPGRLFSVNQMTTCVRRGLFSRNERVITHFDTSIGPMAVVMVGAIFVGSMEMVWHGLVTPPHGQKPQVWTYPPGKHLTRGEEMGRFNMGSTVIVLLPHDAPTWRADLFSGVSVKMGQTIAPASRCHGGDAQTH